jgi:predicted small secreted protein
MERISPMRIQRWQFQSKGRMYMRKIIGMAVIATAILVSACNTVEGVGRDVQSAGSAVENAAN